MVKLWRKRKMTNITAMMERRAEITAELDVIPEDIAHEAEFNETFAKRWAVEETILSCKATTIDAIKEQIRVLAARARDVDDAVAEDLERLAR
jgi:hypothetical protein